MYTIKAIETKLMGFTFRSRLEARWAAFFELCGWNWDYEPVDFNGWIPDFAIYGAKSTIYVEVKPVIAFPEDVAEKIDLSGCEDEVLIVGQTCPIPDRRWIASTLGWLRDMDGCGAWWENCILQWGNGFGFCHAVGDKWDRISGVRTERYYGLWGHERVSRNAVRELWGQAHTATRWMPRS